MAATNRIRWIGAGFVIAGIALTVTAVAITTSGLDGLISTAGTFFVVVPPAMVSVGLAMIISPGEPVAGPFDFADWLHALPRRHQLVIYAAGAAGLAFGVLLLLQLAGWSVAGLIEIVF